MKKLYIIAGIVMSSLLTSAQTDVTAWQLSSTEFGGTSRYNAMAGAFGALGGDVSVLSVNPAGIGLFRRSEYSFTPAFQINTVYNTYLNTTSDDIKGNININNLAYISSKKIDEDVWKNVQFGISYNRLKDFHSNIIVAGVTNESTFADQMASIAGGTASDEFPLLDGYYILPAWETFVINPTDIDQEYASAFLGNEIKQVYTSESKGRIGETSFSLGANYNDRIYLGGAIGFQTVRLTEEDVFSESADYEVAAAELSKYQFTESKVTSGGGINVKLGLIYRVNNIVRAGLAYHSPTFMSLTSTRETDFSSTYNGGEVSRYQSDLNVSDYGLSSPSKYIGSLAFIFGKNGLLDVDYEYVDYSKMKIRNGGRSALDFSGENAAIRKYYQATSNVRVGAEWRVQPFSLRAGAAYYQNPNTDGSSLYATDRLIYTAGVGYKRNSSYVDIAFRYRTAEMENYLYRPEFAHSYTQKMEGNSLSITVGTRF